MSTTRAINPASQKHMSTLETREQDLADYAQEAKQMSDEGILTTHPIMERSQSISRFHAERFEIIDEEFKRRVKLQKRGAA